MPDDLQSFIASQREEWVLTPLEFVRETGRDGTGRDAGSTDHPAVTAAIWYGEHNLDFGYLRNAPRLRFWRTISDDRDEVFVDRRHDDDGEIGFTAGRALRFRVSTSEYVDAVHLLDRELMDAMEQRVADAKHVMLPGLDLADLRREHATRRTQLDNNLDHSPAIEWDVVREGAALLLGDVDRGLA